MKENLNLRRYRRKYVVTYSMMTEEFIASDSASTINVWDTDEWEEARRVNVTIKCVDGNGVVNAQPLHYLNELELWNDQVLANVWCRDHVVAINPSAKMVLNM